MGAGAWQGRARGGTTAAGAWGGRPWGKSTFRDQRKDISFISFGFISCLTTANLREISVPAAAERVFSMLKAMFGDQQMETLAGIIQTALMLRINKRRVG